jgi:phenylacetate-CoA ligase
VLTTAGRMDALGVTAVKDRVGVTVTCEVVEPDTLERSVGKLQRLVDRRTV